MSDDFADRLRKLDEVYAGRPVPAGVQTRTLERLREAHARRHARPWTRQALVLGFVAGSVGALFLLRDPVSREPEASQARLGSSITTPAPAPLTLAGMTLSGLPCEPTRETDVVALPDACRLSGPGLVLATLGPVRLSSAGGDLRVLSGDLRFDVEPRDRAAPLAVAVSGGLIEVVGTRFLVHEEGTRGHVELYEGRLRFVGVDGSERLIAPGERYEWGPGAESPAQPSDPPPSRAPRPKAGRSGPPRGGAQAQEISRRITAHRQRGAHADAASELAQALRAEGWPRATAEVWSYELGTLYADELRDRAAACAHWTAHERRFGEGVYAAAVAASMRRLGCPR